MPSNTSDSRRTILFALLMLAMAGLIPSGGAAFGADAAKAGDAASAIASWTLTTDDTKLTVGVGQDQHLYLYELGNPTAGWNWTSSPSLFPLLSRVDVGGTRHATKWAYQEGTVDSSDGVKLTIRFTNREPALELKSVWHARPGRGPVRHCMFLKNNTGGPITIYEQETFDIHVAGPKADTNVRYINDDASLPDATGVYGDRLTSGYQKTLPITSKDQDWIPYVVVDSNGKCGVYVGWEWSNGRMAIAADQTSNGAFLKVGNRDDFRTDLSAGETFEVPPGFVGAYAGDLDDAGNSVRRYLFHYNMPEMLKRDASFPKVEWNAFAATGKGQGSWDPTEKKYYPFIDDIAPLGFEEVVIDIGWWSSYGDPGHIVTDAADWPSGMAAAAKYAHERGLRFGLYDNEPELFTSESGKRERIEDISFLLKQLHADFYRSDETAAPVIQGAFGAGHRAHYPEDVLYWSTKGFYEVLDTLYARYPTFLWENCAGGGRIKDFGASRRAAKIQNQDRYYAIDARRSFYDSSYVFPPMQLAALDGSWAELQAAGSVYEFRSSSMGAAYWHPDAPNGGNGGPVWSAQHKAQIKRAVATYKDKLRPLIRGGDLYHIFPRPDGLHWDGMEYFDRAAKRGVVYLFKPAEGNGNDATKVALRGVRADARYRVTFEDGTNAAVERSGAELIAGIEVHLCGGMVSELMFFEEIAPAKK
jgi:hypothetical protein